jgi:Ni/Co efflux regulator RcnB
MEARRKYGKINPSRRVMTMSTPVRLIFVSAVAIGLAPATTSVAQTLKPPPRGGTIPSGPYSTAARGPNGEVTSGPSGAAVLGPNSGPVGVRRQGNGASTAHRTYGGSTGHVYTYGGRHFHGEYAPPFAYPPGSAYRRWAVGAVLPAVFLTSTYYFTGYAAMGLPPPVTGHQWLRYGPDLLLVDTRTGAVLHAAYGVFKQG